MRVLITGATSMIGTALVHRLADQGEQVIAVMRNNPEKERAFSASKNIEIIHSDMQDYGSLSMQIRGEIDAAFLAAWNGTRGSERMNANIQMENVQANVRILPELAKLGCKKILTAGSQAEYGPWTSTERLSETEAAYPDTEYGKSKLVFYLKAQAFCDENDIVLIEPRFFSLYGPDDYEKTLVISVLHAMLDNKPCNMTKCIQKWDYLYIDDAIDGMIKLLTEKVPKGIYNFGYGDSRILKEFVEDMYRLTNSHSQLCFGVVPYPETGMVNINPDVSKLKSIGWIPKTSFEDGVKKVIKKLKAMNHFVKEGEKTNELC